MKPRRLCLVISSLGAGGSERVMSILANQWAGAGAAVTLITLAATVRDHYPVDSRVERIELDLLWNSHGFLHSVQSNARRLRLLRRAVVNSNPDVVISFIDQVNVRVLASLVATGIPVVISERTNPRSHHLSPTWKWLRRLSYPLADALVVQTRLAERWASRFLPARKLHVIPNPLVIPTVNIMPVVRRRKIVIGVGRLSREKGFDLLLDAFAQSGLGAKGWRLRILGDGPDRMTLQAQSERLGVASYTEFVGVVADPFSWLRQADIFVLPSRLEGFPNALLEAMACGLAVVAFDCETGPGAIVRHDQDGLLVPPENIDALAEMLRALATDECLRRRLGTAARGVVDRYAVGHIVAAWETVLGNVLARPPHARRGG